MEGQVDAFAELGAASNFSFLHGASHPEELVVTAASFGYRGIAVCDRNSLAGVVRAHLAARQIGLKSAVGCRLVFRDGTPDCLVWPTDRAAYGRLCRLLTVGNMRGEKGVCRLDLGDLVDWCEGLVIAIVAETGCAGAIEKVVAALPEGGEPLRLAVNRPYGPQDERRLRHYAELARSFGLRPLATNLPLYHDPCRRPLQDVLTAIREHTTIDAAGRRLMANAEHHLKRPSEMARLFQDWPEALDETIAVLERLSFSLDTLRYEYPEEPSDPGRTPHETLVRLVEDGARIRYLGTPPKHVADQIRYELDLVEQLAYAPYFLTVYDIVRFARTRGILAQGRGSAANSTICYCLGITDVDPEHFSLLFERFISPDRREPPDIDVDFEHERREEVIQYIYNKYGRDRAGIAATVISYRARSAAREIGKALGLSEDSVSALSSRVWGRSDKGIGAQEAARSGFDPGERRMGHLIRLSREIAGFPRHLSQHVGGFVITRGRLDELVPIVKAAMDDRTHIEWDKDDLDALGILKIDVLALGMLTCLRKALALIAEHYSEDFALRTGDRAALSSPHPRAGEAIGATTLALRGRGAREGKEEAGHGQPPPPWPARGGAVGGFAGAASASASTSASALCGSASGAGGPASTWGALRGAASHGTARPAFGAAAGGAGLAACSMARERGALDPVLAADGERLDTVAPRRAEGAFTDREPISFEKAVGDAGMARPARAVRQGEGGASGTVIALPSAQHAPPIRRREAEQGVPQYEAWPVTLATIPSEDPAVYAMISRADTLGVFQIESRAQMTMLPRLRPHTFYDLVIEVAIVRPGPIQGDMVHPYLRRRQKKEIVAYPSKELEGVLSKTLGVPLFQEQAMRIAIVAAGFTPSEADQLRRAMATFKKVGTIGTFRDKMVDGMVKRGYDPTFAARCFKQIEGFGEYGFPESHATSFALLVYGSCWLKCYYPDVFCAALLNSQPMGFYAPSQIVRDARQHGVEVRPVDVNLSDWDARLEAGEWSVERLHPDHASMRDVIRSRRAVRLGFRQVKGLEEEALTRLVALRGKGYDSVRDLWLRTGLSRATIERLADADAFASIGLSRRDAAWAARGLDRDSRPEDLPLFAAADYTDLQYEAPANLPPMPPGEEVINDYRFLSLSLKGHPVAFVRRHLQRERIIAAENVGAANQRRISVAGLVLVRQRPGSAKGVIFMTLEDETGVANVIVWPKVFEAYRQIVLGARFVKVTGRVQAQDGVIHVVAERLDDRTDLLSELAEKYDDWSVLDRADEVKRPGVDARTENGSMQRLARLLDAMAHYQNDTPLQDPAVSAALDAHRRAAARIAGGAAPTEREAETIRPAPRATWGTARTAASDVSKLGDKGAAKSLRRALPKGRNFH
ncbi:OB-fold nucleic acid binding domain-containing protein [Acuticoccus sp. M5D2P5]|uniref:helix-hairpin-helix domain-containing protein n=1 Tax=Acuticoccus kalidii TaxID=2910977 RepID=UPI001F1F70A1|nr:OB-fold nucleic acid binding domain-containing protein [Acuticoccus kalidii]MCF3932286.1 OB-fold nucleic acid binding domain-containing protein [Acuticoccus kalidii]